MKVLILTTRQNHVWTSMQEIIPSLENLWSSLEGIESQIINVDEISIKDLLPKVLWAENFVVTAFNLKIVSALEVVRKSIKHPGRIFFYMHNMQTIGAWPLEAWGLNKLLNTNDRFIVTCENDIRSMKLCYENARYFKHPFFIENQVVRETVCKEEDVDFIFIGRISAQKNLHNLIWAFSKYLNVKKSDAKLIFYGKEDDLGSPNMGWSCENYMEKLRSYSEDLSIEKNVIFRGFVNRDEIERELEHRDYVFISPSLHSDENFGIAAFRSLISGRRAVLSDWGGHSDYRNYFEKQLELIPVEQSSFGPVVSSEAILESMLNISSKESLPSHCPSYYEKSSLARILTNELSRESEEHSELILTVEAREVVNRQKGLENNFSTGIFNDYSDKLSHTFFSAYGMRSVERKVEFDRNFYDLSPWSEIKGNRIEITDPHKSCYSFEIETGNYPLRDLARNTRYVSKSIVEKLYSGGFCRISNLDLSTSRYLQDHCSVSIEILRERVLKFFEVNNIENPYFADCEEQSVDESKVVNIVLFGGYLQRILESGCWNFNKFHFWVLSPSVKKVLVEICGLEADSISVIPREELFSISKVKKVSLEKSVDLVYAGRISRVKNIELLIYTNYYLQVLLKKDIKLNLIGDFDENYHDYWGYFSSSKSYEEELNELVKSLDWPFSKPVFLRKVDHDKWALKNFTSPHYISLSSYLSEDFAVSVAQAQEKGWPCILSNWGAHQDVKGATLVSVNNILPYLKRNIFIKAYGENIAKEIISSKTICLGNNLETFNRLVVTPKEMDQVRSNLVNKYSRNIMLILRGAGERFAQQSIGEAFYEDLAKRLGGYSLRNSILIVKDGVNEVGFLENKATNDLSSISEISKYEILTASEVVKKRNLIKVMQAESIAFSFPKEDGVELFQFVSSLVEGEDKIFFLKDEHV